MKLNRISKAIAAAVGTLVLVPLAHYGIVEAPTGEEVAAAIDAIKAGAASAVGVALATFFAPKNQE